VTATRTYLARLARDNGLRIAAAGTHPFSHWASVEITGGNPRYERLVEELQMVARANLIFGLHVHIGVEDREAQIRIMNQVAYFLPHVLTLAVNSPFWLGRDTGWMSYRCKVFDKFPRTNMPDYFSSYGEFQEYVNLLVKTGCVIDGRQIWWDVRPHVLYPTLEYRICDIPMRVDETIAIAALFQAITAKLYRLGSGNLTFRPYRRALIMEGVTPKVVRAKDVPESALWVHDEKNINAAKLLADLFAPDFPIPVGVLTAVDAPVYEDLMLEQEQKAVAERIAGPDFYKEGAESIKRTLARAEELQRELAAAYARWGDLDARK